VRRIDSTRIAQSLAGLPCDSPGFYSRSSFAHPPSPHRGKEVRFRHITQARGKAPTFVFFVDPPEGVHFTYARYLENRIRERFGFPGTPIKLEFRASFE